MATKKNPTKNERYEELLAIPAVATNEGLVKFIKHEQELLARKSTSKSGEKKLTPRQQENVTLRETILGLLGASENPLTITDLLGSLPKTEEMTHGRVSALLSQLAKGGEVKRSKNKGKTLFALADPKAEAETETEEVEGETEDDPETSDEG